jgi:hypothetical protein
MPAVSVREDYRAKIFFANVDLAHGSPSKILNRVTDAKNGRSPIVRGRSSTTALFYPENATQNPIRHPR